ncbi:hypothetical protein BDV97DRAFT_182768 [Delphinella strobiligena]|nr:hypothetical protein BDV97DRAFT_182768 [Delphinella strobiligena]
MRSMLIRPARLHNPILPSSRSFLSRPLRPQFVRNATISNLTTPASPKPVQAASFAQRGRVVNQYPQRLLIFHSPAAATAWTALSKAATIALFGIGCLQAAPNVYNDPNQPSWLVPAVIVGSAMPLVLVSFMTAPFVSDVFIRLPDWARKSRDSLKTFARRMPPDTRLDFQKIGFLPFPRTRGVQLSELRTLSSSKALANLEHVPHANAGKHTPAWLRLARGYLYLRPKSSHWQKTPAPDVWPLVLDHIQRNSIAAGSVKQASPAATRKRVASAKEGR